MSFFADIVSKIKRVGVPTRPSFTPLPPELAASTLGAATHGVEIHNDATTPIEFVIYLLEDYFGLEEKEAVKTTLRIHNKGSATLPCGSRDRAEGLARHVLEEAKKHGHVLACKSVALQG